MATALQICNSAIIKLGAKTISALSAPTTKEGELVIAQYPRLRNALLRSHVWGFAKVVDDALTTVASDALVNQYDFKHTLPTAIPIARLLSVTDDQDVSIQYEIIGAYMYSNTEDPRLRYVRSYTAVDDAATFPDDFAETLANLLAADICVSLTQNQSLRDTYMRAYEYALTQARFNGAIETYPVQGVTVDWLAAHSGLYDSNDPDRRGLDAEESFP